MINKDEKEKFINKLYDEETSLPLTTKIMFEEFLLGPIADIIKEQKQMRKCLEDADKMFMAETDIDNLNPPRLVQS